MNGLKLFLITAGELRYSTTAIDEKSVRKIFKNQYPLYQIDRIDEISAEDLYDMDDDDEIKFF